MKVRVEGYVSMTIEERAPPVLRLEDRREKAGNIIRDRDLREKMNPDGYPLLSQDPNSHTRNAGEIILSGIPDREITTSQGNTEAENPPFSTKTRGKGPSSFPWGGQDKITVQERPRGSLSRSGTHVKERAMDHSCL